MTVLEQEGRLMIGTVVSEGHAEKVGVVIVHSVGEDC